MKILDGTKYVAKNFWKVLPVGSLINHENKTSALFNDVEHHTPMSINDLVKDAFHVFYAIVGGLAITAYAANKLSDGTYTQSPYLEKSHIKQTEQIDTIARQNELEKSVK